MTDAVLEVDHLTKTFRIHRERANSLKQRIAAKGRNRFDEFVALEDVSFDVHEGEVFGVIGHNGSGKSTLLKCMAGILQPNQGSVRVHRRMSALLALGAGFHPELSGRENVFLNAAILGMGRRDIAARFDEIVAFSGLERFIDQPVKTYSSGMYVRLAFSVAINVDPRLLIIDEVLAVGDVTFQKRCLEKFVDFRNDGRTIVLVTHDLASVRNMCDRAIWLKSGIVTGEGDPKELVDAYTDSMLGSSPKSDSGSIRRGSGEVIVNLVEMYVGDDANPVLRCQTGDTVRFRLFYTATKAVPKPLFSLVIDALGGATLTAPCTRDVGLIPDMIEGEGYIDVVLRDLSLLPGAYEVHTIVHDFNRQHEYDHLQLASRFDVTTGKPYEALGLITLRPEWRFSDDRNELA
jgi:ABC-type polysaccharide/polyol phosphate transport system ATPase subunit